MPKPIKMTRILRASRHLLAAVLAGGLFLLLHANPLAQSNKPQAPKSHVTDLAGVVDAQTRARLEGVLERLKEKSDIDFYVAVVDSTDGVDVAEYSQRLAREWNIATKTGRTKSLLLVISAASKTSFTQFARVVQSDLPDGVLGELSYRMSGPLGEGRFTEAVETGVYAFVNAVAEKKGFNAADLERPVVTAEATSQPPADTTQAVLISANEKPTTRPRTVAETPKPVATPPNEPSPEPAPTEAPTPQPTSTETPTPQPTTTEAPAPQPTATEAPTPQPTATEAPTPQPTTTEVVKTEAPTETPTSESPKPKNPARKTPAKAAPAPRKLTPAQQAELDADESEEVELTLTLPLAKRADALKEFLDKHPESKSRARATELLISTHAALGDQQLKAGETAAGTEQLFHAIDEADATITDDFFTGVISQIPMNLYMRGEHAAAFKAAQNVEAKFGTDAKRLIALANFYLNVERGAEVVRVGEAAVKLAPDMAEAHRILALGLHISLRLDEAAAEYKRTLELDPNSKVSRGSLADLYRASGKTEEALALYNEQLTADSKDRAARAGKVISLFELNREDEANRELEAALTEEPRNLPLLAGTAYWLVAHGNSDKAIDLARKAIAIEPRYTWAQIALVRALLASNRPIEAERSMRYAKQYGKFPTMTYELATVLASMGLYEEAVEVLRESFSIKDDQVHAYLAGQIPASDANFMDLLAPERRASIYQKNAADSATNAKSLKALLALNTAITPPEGGKIDETAAAAAAREFASGTDNMRAFRQLYAASRLLRNGVALSTVIDLADQARKAADDALTAPSLTMAVQADEFRELRSRAIAAGNVPDVADAPQSVLKNILKGRIEDIEGWALFAQQNHTEAVTHLKLAAETLPAGTPAWRTALWHLGAALEQTDQKQQALDYYIKSYTAGEPDTIRRSVIEQLYKKINGSLDGLDQRITAGGFSTGSAATETTAAPAPAPVPDTTAAAPVPTSPTETSSSTPAPVPPEIPKTESPKPDAPTPAAELSEEEAMRLATTRRRSTIKITGRVLDASGVGLPSALLMLVTPTGNVITSTTDNDGKYSFTVAAPSQRTYRIIPSKDGYAFTPIDKTFAGLFDDRRDIDFVGNKQ
ncbi:MAG TPA: tetratricopeptide repeat protein [Pyrinomonadaceae bacterium]|nr:tetratricopeptide repeat protein [Pyrinomonadaceae bacterium]